jgi:hypothetical protein
MFPSRTTFLLVLSLGSAASLGWLCDRPRPIVNIEESAKAVVGPVIHPSPTYPHGRHSVPGRHRTNPDPTPDDWGDECSSLLDLNNHGSEWAVLEPVSQWTTACPIESPSPEWSEPAPTAQRLRLTLRFRC